MLASFLLKERLNLHGKVGCLLCILGSTVLVLHAPEEKQVGEMEQLSPKLKDPRKFILINMFLKCKRRYLIYKNSNGIHPSKKNINISKVFIILTTNPKYHSSKMSVHLKLFNDLGFEPFYS